MKQEYIEVGRLGYWCCSIQIGSYTIQAMHQDRTQASLQCKNDARKMLREEVL
jgi:uncharacterized protein YegJ (DUF2314 family)